MTTESIKSIPGLGGDFTHVPDKLEHIHCFFIVWLMVIYF